MLELGHQIDAKPRDPSTGSYLPSLSL
jgi:hypothetical protein